MLRNFLSSDSVFTCGDSAKAVTAILARWRVEELHAQPSLGNHVSPLHKASVIQPWGLKYVSLACTLCKCDQMRLMHCTSSTLEGQLGLSKPHDSALVQPRLQK